MGSFKNFEEKQPIEVQILGKRDQKLRFIIKSVTEDTLIASTSVMEVEDTRKITVGSTVKVSYIDKVAIHIFFSQVLATSDYPTTITLGKPMEMKRLQRRDFVRVDVKMIVDLTCLDEKGQETESFSARTVDVSGGGILIACNKELQNGQILGVTLQLGQSDFVHAEANVARVMENSSGSKEAFYIGLAFTNIQEKDRDKIVKFVLNEQRILRKKGLI